MCVPGVKWGGECDVMVCGSVLGFPPGVKWGSESERDVMVCVPELWLAPGMKWGGEHDVMVCVPVLWFPPGG